MKPNRKWLIRLSTGLLVCLTLTGVALAAGQQGTQSDPLVTLSYLTQRATPEILAQVDLKLNQRENELKNQLSTVVSSYVREVEDKLRAAGGVVSSPSGGAVYEAVTLRAGQIITGGATCEFLLRSGTAVCVSGTAPGLIDMTGGATLASGSALTANHLYLTAGERGAVRADTAVTLMVRGSYTIT